MFKCLIVIAAALMPLETARTQQPTARELLDKYAVSSAKLRSFVAKTDATYRVHWHHQEQPEVTRLTSELRLDGNRMHLLHYVWQGLPALEANPPARDAIYRADLWDGRRSITYIKHMAEGVRSAEISAEQRPVKHNAVVWCAGVPLLGIRDSEYEPIETVLRQAGSLSVRPALEPVGSIDCYVIDANAASGKYTVWLDPQHGYQIARAQIHLDGKDLFRGRALQDHESQSLSLGSVRFENMDGVWVPMQAILYQTSIRRRQDSSCTSIGHHKITQITLNPDHEALGSFTPVVENGTHVRDRDSGTIYTWQNGRVVDLEDRSAHELRPKRFVKW